MKGEYELKRTVLFGLFTQKWTAGLWFGEKKGFFFPPVFFMIVECWINFQHLKVKVIKSLNTVNLSTFFGFVAWLSWDELISKLFIVFSCYLPYPPRRFFQGRFWGSSIVFLGICSRPIEAPCKSQRQEILPRVCLHIPQNWWVWEGAEGSSAQRRLSALCGKLMLSLKEIYYIFAELSRKLRFIV